MTARAKAQGIARALLLPVAIGFLLYAAAGNWLIVSHPYQHEFREGAPVVFVKTMLNGQNPYALELQPATTYVYGFLYPLLNFPISKLFGATLLNARLMSWLYVWATVLLIFRFAFRRHRSVAIAAFCTVPFLFTEPVKTTAQPNDLGILLMVATVLIVYEHRFSRASLVLSVVLSLLGFYAKAFFLVGITYVAAYLFLFRSKRTAIRYFALAMAAWGASLWVVHRLFPAYLNDCVIHHAGVATYSRFHVYEQIAAYWSRSTFLVLVVVALVAAALRKIQPRRLRIDLIHLDQPFINGIAVRLYFELSALIMGLIFFYKLGGHAGSWDGVYINQLFSPLLVLVVAEKFESYTTPRWLQCLAAIGLIAFMVPNGRRQYQAGKMGGDFARQIAVIERAMAGKKVVMNSEFTASIAVAQDREIYDSGQGEYFITGNNKYSKLVYGDAIGEANTRYLQEVQRKIESKYFDLVLVATGWNLPGSLSTHYDKKVVHSFPGILDAGPVEFWERK
jgi:hypothetical protein